MSYETQRTEVEDWWNSELSQTEEWGLVETIQESAGYISSHDFANNPGLFRPYKKNAKIHDRDGDTATIITLWWSSPANEGGGTKIRIDERLQDVEGHRWTMSVWRRTTMDVSPSDLINPILVDQSYGLKRRASKDFRRPRDQAEEDLMEEYPEPRKSSPLQVDRILAESALHAMAVVIEETASGAEGNA